MCLITLFFAHFKKCYGTPQRKTVSSFKEQRKNMKAMCCMLPRAHSEAKETQNVLLLGWLCVHFFAYKLSQRSVAQAELNWLQLQQCS